MNDPLEDRLRAHFTGKAAQAQADPDPGALMERAAGHSAGRRMLVGAVVLGAVLAGSGALAGAELAGGGSSSPSQLAAAPSTTVPSTTVGGGAGTASPDASGDPNLPATTSPTPYTLLFTRTTSAGVTIRSYETQAVPIENCTNSAPCSVPPVVPLEPGSTTGSGATGSGTTGSGATGSGTANAGGVALPPATTTTTTGTSTTTVTTTATTPTIIPTTTTSTTTLSSQPSVGCGSLVVELSTDRAVGTGSVPRPGEAAPTPTTVEILGSGSFGTAEGAPVGWVAVWVGSGVTSVTLSEGGQTDSMAPESGIAVLALPGDASLTGATVAGYDQSGAAVSTVPVTPAAAAVTEGAGDCPGVPITSVPPDLPVTPSTPAGVPTPVQSPSTPHAP